MPIDEWQARSARIVAQIEALEQFKRAKVVHSFIPDETHREVNLIPLLEKIISSKTLLAPVVAQKDLISVQINSVNELERNAFGILEPKAAKSSPLESEIDLVLAPLLAVDKAGNRLGYGKGYYDRFFKRLKKNVLKLGVAFKFQILNRVPTTENDVKLDAIATEENIITISF